MILRKNIHPSTILRVGYLSLAIALTARWVFEGDGRKGTNLTDGVEGLLFGIAIGTLLLGMYLKSRVSRAK